MNRPIETLRKRDGIPYGAYYRRDDLSVSEAERVLVDSRPGTSMGEYMRRFWQPVCLSQELTDVPKAIKVLYEELVAFRDRSGRVGVLQRHCCHRGTSLEFGIIQPRGIRCCYHGWQYDVDGTVLEMPCEPKDSKLHETVTQGAYPAFERDGIVFAYMGPPEKKPPFPEYDSYREPVGTKLVPFSNVYACNWLQVYENLIDHFHSAVLHNHMTVDDLDTQLAAGLNLAEGFFEMPVIEWAESNDGNGFFFAAARRVAEDRIWVRISQQKFPNYVATASIVPTAAKLRHATVSMSRWQVPVDDENMIVLGWRHFNDEIDPEHMGREADCGVDQIDFLDGQTANRTYEQKQRGPGDYEAITSQRPVALHHLEHPAKSDVGVYQCRQLLRTAAGGRNAPDPFPYRDGNPLAEYTSDTVLRLPRAEGEADREVLLQAARSVVAVMRECEALPSVERKARVFRLLDAIDGGLEAPVAAGSR